MRAIDVFGVLPPRAFALGDKLIPNWPKHGVPEWENGIWLYTDSRGNQTVIAKQGTLDANGNWSGCEQGIAYDAWIAGGRLNPCTGLPVAPPVEKKPGSALTTPSTPGAPVPTAPAPAPEKKSSTVPTAAIVAGGAGVAGLVALFATGVIKL